MRRLPAFLITLLLATPAFAVELFRYRGAAKDGGTLEYVFEAGEQNSPNAVTKEKAAEIAADFMSTFYHEQVGALENLGQRPYRSGWSAFRTPLKVRSRICSSSFCCQMERLLCRRWRNGSGRISASRRIGLSIVREAPRSLSEVTTWFSLSRKITDGQR
jgi:hypothetical protein